METLYNAVSKFKDDKHTALYFENKKISYMELNKNIRKMMTFLSEKGIKKGDVVTIVLPNLPQMVYLFYALNGLGAISNIVHPLTPVDAIISNMKSVKSKTAVVLETLYGENKDKFLSSGYDFFFVNPMYDKSILYRHIFYLKYNKVVETDNIFSLDKFRKSKESNLEIKTGDRENSIYLHSGGTTSLPKTIALSDSSLNNLANKIYGIIEDKNIQNKSMLAVLPCFHGFGLGMGVHSVLYNGGISYLMIKFNAKKVIKLINQHKINYIIGVPLLYKKLLSEKSLEKADLSALEYCFIGGDNVDKKLITDFNSFMENHGSPARLFEGYGLTETVTVCTVNTRKDYKIGSVGKPLKDIEITIRNDNMEKLNFGEIGEVYVSGDTLMNEYLEEKQATDETLVNLNGKLWVRTQDIGYLDKDGFLYLKGRKKRLIKINGVNVYPAEIEKSLSEIDDIKLSALVAFDKPRTHLVLYVIKDKNSYMTDEELNSEIYSHIKGEFYKYCMPEKIVYMDKFPLTKVGKIDYNGFTDDI